MKIIMAVSLLALFGVAFLVYTLRKRRSQEKPDKIYYMYKGRKIYRFNNDPAFAGQPVAFFDAETDQYVGAPYGGVTGKGDCTMLDFAEEAKRIY